MKPSKKQLAQLARLELEAWSNKRSRRFVSPGVVMAILFAFCHRLSTGETVEELIDRCRPAIWSYEI